ncbi:MAG: tetratricopeptide repeat protein [Pyrinomonadaceae bacterium]
MIVREAIQAAAGASVPNLLKLARTAEESSNHQEAYDYFSRVLELDGDNSEAWAGKGAAAGWLSRLPEMIKCFRNAIEVAPSESRAAIRKKAAASMSRVTTHSFHDMHAQTISGVRGERTLEPVPVLGSQHVPSP